MPWKLEFDQNTDAKGVGTINASYSDDSLSFAVSQRLDTNDGKSIDLFINECRESLAKRQSEVQDKNTIVAKIEAVLNG